MEGDMLYVSSVPVPDKSIRCHI